MEKVEQIQQDNDDDDDDGHGHDDDGDHGRVYVRVYHVDGDREHDHDDVDGCEHVDGRGYDHELLCIVPGIDLACRDSLDTLLHVD